MGFSHTVITFCFVLFCGFQPYCNNVLLRIYMEDNNLFPVLSKPVFAVFVSERRCLASSSEEGCAQY